MSVKTDGNTVVTCRTCMWKITDDSQVIQLDAVVKSKDASTTIRKQLMYCIPELDVESKFSTVICSDCVIALDFVCKFKQKCITTESLIVNSLLNQSTTPITHQIKSPQETDDCVMVTDGDDLQTSHLEVVDSDLVQLNSVPVNDVVIVDDEMDLAPNDNMSNNDVNWLSGYAIPNDKEDEIVVTANSTPNTSKTDMLGCIVPVTQPLQQLMVKQFKCRICEFISSSKEQITTHVKTHNRCFRCMLCGSSTIYYRVMLDHLSTAHSNIKAYKCAECLFITKTALELIKHVESHNHQSNSKKVHKGDDSNVICLD